MKGLGDVSYAAMMGYFVKDNSSPIDFFIVGKVNRRRLKTFISQLEKESKRELNYSLMSIDEFENRKLMRSEEHTSELQSHSFISYAVFCLKKKK